MAQIIGDRKLFHELIWSGCDRACWAHNLGEILKARGLRVTESGMEGDELDILSTEGDNILATLSYRKDRKLVKEAIRGAGYVYRFQPTFESSSPTNDQCAKMIRYNLLESFFVDDEKMYSCATRDWVNRALLQITTDAKRNELATHYAACRVKVDTVPTLKLFFKDEAFLHRLSELRFVEDYILLERKGKEGVHLERTMRIDDLVEMLKDMV